LFLISREVLFAYEWPLCANSGRSKFDPAPGSMSAINRLQTVEKMLVDIHTGCHPV
jgi:hypothetical protein